MPLLTMDEVRERLDPLTTDLLVKPSLTGVKGWNDLVIATPAVAVTVTPTTRAGLIHDFTVREVRGALVGRTDARELTAFRFFALAISDDLVLRFKFVTSGLPRNVATDIQELLALQQYDEDTMSALSLEGVPHPPTFVTCGYTLDYDGQVGKLSVQCDRGNITMWRYFVWEDAAEGTGSFENLPISPEMGPDAVTVRSTRKYARKRGEDAK